MSIGTGSPGGPAPQDPLPAAAREQLRVVLALLAEDPASLSSIRDPAQGWRVHVADSLAGLALVEELAGARPRALAIADVGSGAGFPGTVLAAALPAARVDLIESVERKCRFMSRAVAQAGIANARVVCARAESWAREPPPAGGREGYDAVTARAVGRLATLAELASPLLRADGALVAWKGKRNPGEEEELERAADRLAMRLERTVAAPSTAGSSHRHLHLIRKTGPTPTRLPRRPGMAKKRPLGAAPRRLERA